MMNLSLLSVILNDDMSSDYWFEKCCEFFNWKPNNEFQSQMSYNWNSELGCFRWNQTLRVNTIWDFCQCHINRKTNLFTSVKTFLNEFYFSVQTNQPKKWIFEECHCIDPFIENNENTTQYVTIQQDALAFSKLVFMKCIEICLREPFQNTNNCILFDDLDFANRLLWEFKSFRCDCPICDYFLWYPEEIWHQKTKYWSDIDWDEFCYRRERHRDEREECIKTFKSSRKRVFLCLTENLRSNLSLIQKAIEYNEDDIRILKYVPHLFLNLPQTASFLIEKYGGKVLEYLDKSIETNVNESIQKNPYAIQHLDSRQLKNLKYSFVMNIIRNDPLTLQYLGIVWQNNFDICHLAVSLKTEAFRYVGKKLKQNNEQCETLIYLAAKNDGGQIKHLPRKSSLRDDEKLILVGIKSNVKAFQFSSKSLRSNKYFVIKAIIESKDRICIDHMDENLRSDPDVVLCATKYIDWYIPYLNTQSPNIINNKEIVLAMLSKNPEFFNRVPKELQNDEDIAAQQLSKNGLHLQKLTKSSRENEILCFIAISQNGNAIQFIPEKMLNHFLVETALKSNLTCYKKLPVNWRHDMEVVKYIFHQDANIAKEIIGKKLQDKYEKTLL
jgi:hypothetical protein